MAFVESSPGFAPCAVMSTVRSGNVGFLNAGIGNGAFAGAILIGGSNFVAVRYSNRELDPLWGAGFRFALAAAVFGVLVALIAMYLGTVTSKKYEPGGKKRKRQSSDL